MVKSRPLSNREFGHAMIDIKAASPLFADVWNDGENHQVWMSHGDKVEALPDGFSVIATSSGAPYAAVADEARQLYGVQFHPEVVHTPGGGKLAGKLCQRYLRPVRRLDHGQIQRRSHRHDSGTSGRC